MAGFKFLDFDGVQFVIIDDENDYPSELQGRLIHTNAIRGLSINDVEKAILILNDKNLQQ